MSPHRCKGGDECILGTEVCENNTNCNDGSDEDPDLCATWNPSDSKNSNGKYQKLLRIRTLLSHILKCNYTTQLKPCVISLSVCVQETYYEVKLCFVVTYYYKRIYCSRVAFVGVVLSLILQNSFHAVNVCAKIGLLTCGNISGLVVGKRGRTSPWLVKLE